MMSGGFEVLVDVAKHNAEAVEEEWQELVEGERREGIPVGMWRALKPSAPDGS